MASKPILIVDDEPIVRESIRDWLKDAGYDVAAAESGEEALDMIEKRDFSVMVLDIRLPGKTGLRVLKEIKAVKPGIKSIIITAYPSEETTEEARKLGAIDYLIKPLVPDDLEKLIRDTLESMGKEPTVKMVEVPAKPPEVVEVKKLFTITRQGLKSLVEGLAKEMEVIGVKAKQGKFAYDNISSFDELRLDYDVTILPPTRYFLPAKETLLKFKIGGNGFEPVVDTRPIALVGVHPYDINAIELLDEVFTGDSPDPNYVARRQR